MDFKYLEGVKKKDLTEELLIDTWLKEYHKTTLEEVKKDYNTNKDGNYNPEDTSDFYNKYSVTQEEHDNWDNQIRKELKPILRLNKQMFNRVYSFLYLNIAPSIKQ